MRKIEKKMYWRRLDNSAKIFPLIVSKDYSSVFRLSVLLNENINQNILKKAVLKALKSCKTFKVKIGKGLFWYYFEKNDKEPLIELEQDYPCMAIDLEKNNDYLFKVTYFENKINIDVFHALTDGKGGFTFLKEILYNYLDIAHLDKCSRNKKETNYNAEDEYMRVYDKKAKKKKEMTFAYTLKGNKMQERNSCQSYYNGFRRIKTKSKR